jgi:replication factor C subunit 2/4
MNNSPWIEKYRPRLLSDVILPPLVLTEINNILNKKSIPNIIITGTPGIGKTTTLLCISRQLYGKYANNAVLEINASDDRGIKSVQTLITDFCNTVFKCNDEDKGKYAKKKLIIFDEADGITEKAQHLISALMTKYVNTRFAFTCNTSHNIIESIQTRCKILRYSRIETPLLIKGLKKILKVESINFTLDGIKQIALLSQGDMRHAINLMQLTCDRYGKVNDKTVANICEMPRPSLIKEIIVNCINKQYKKAIELILNLKKQGYTGSDIILSFLNTLKHPIVNDIDELNKIKFYNIACITFYDITRGIDSDLQLCDFITQNCKKE